MFLRMREPALDPASVLNAEEQLKALHGALAACRAVAQREKKWRTAVTAALVPTFAALAVMAGVSLVDRVSKPALRGANAAYVAYKNEDDHTALRIARPLAEQGDARAQTVLGLIYQRGHAVERDDPRALRWLRRAAAQGDGIAQFHLGITYDQLFPGLHRRHHRR